MAYIEDAALVKADAGSIEISAQSDAAINIIAAAASIAFAGGGGNSTALSGGGAVASNIISSDTRARGTRSKLQASGGVKVNAANESDIEAKILAFSGSIAIGGGNAVGASIGAAIAQNLIGWTRDSTGVLTNGVRKPGQRQA